MRQGFTATLNGATLSGVNYGHDSRGRLAGVADASGNLLGDGRWVCAWNGENRLIQMETGPAAILAGVPRERYQFAYDSRGRRISKTAEKWDASAGAWAYA